MPLAYQKVLAEKASPSEQELEITVIFTSVDDTLRALRTAGSVAHDLNAFITLVVPQIVPFPLPLTSPPVLLEFNERRFRVIAANSPVKTTVRIYLCRDRSEMLNSELQPSSIVVIGGKRRWWPSTERRMARKLRRAGHHVILAEA